MTWILVLRLILTTSGNVRAKEVGTYVLRMLTSDQKIEIALAGLTAPYESTCTCKITVVNYFMVFAPRLRCIVTRTDTRCQLPR